MNLKVVQGYPFLTFYYSSDQINWKLLCKNIDATYLSTATGGFTSTTIENYMLLVNN